jgi:hypothetical protein
MGAAQERESLYPVRFLREEGERPRPRRLGFPGVLPHSVICLLRLMGGSVRMFESASSAKGLFPADEDKEHGNRGARSERRAYTGVISGIAKGWSYDSE